MRRKRCQTRDSCINEGLRETGLSVQLLRGSLRSWRKLCGLCGQEPLTAKIAKRRPQRSQRNQVCFAPPLNRTVILGFCNKDQFSVPMVSLRFRVRSKKSAVAV